MSVVLALVGAACGGGGSSGGAGPAEADLRPLEPVDVPSTPAAAPQPTGTPEARALALADLVDATAADPIPGWLAVYDAIGIPVIGTDGQPVGVADPDVSFGPYWWQVWSVTRLANPSVGIGMVDLSSLIVETADGEALGEAMLADLRADIESGDPARQLFGLFVRERIRRGPAGVDLAVPDVSLAEVSVDVPLAQLLAWVVLRGLVQDVAERLGEEGGRAPSTLGEVPDPCHPVTSEDGAGLTASVIRSLLGGIMLPNGKSVFSGYIQTLVQSVTGDEDLAKAARQTYGAVRRLFDVLSLLAQLASLKLDAVVDGALQRTDLARGNGQQKTTSWRLYSDPNVGLDGSRPVNCVLTYLALQLGIKMYLPVPGPIKGSEIIFTGMDGFAGRGDRVLFENPEKQLKQDTNAAGEAELGILGRAQKQDLKDPNPIDTEYSVRAAAQPQEETFSSIASMFTDSFIFGTVPQPATIVRPIIDIIRVMHFDFGEYVFPMKDWEVSCGAEQSGRAPAQEETCKANTTVSYHWLEEVDYAAGGSSRFEYTFTIGVKLKLEDREWVDDGSTFQVTGTRTSIHATDSCYDSEAQYTAGGTFIETTDDYLLFSAGDDGSARLEATAVTDITGNTGRRIGTGNGEETICEPVTFENVIDLAIPCPAADGFALNGTYDEESGVVDLTCSDTVNEILNEGDDYRHNVDASGSFTLPS